MNAAVPECVRLTVAGVGGVDAHVVRAVPGAVELAFDGRPPVPARLLHRRRAHVSPLPPGPAAALAATVLAVPDARGTLRSDIVHALLDRPDACLPVARAYDRRTAERIPVRRTATIHRSRGEAGIPAQTHDLSPGGIALEGAPRLLRGDVVHVRVALDAGDERYLEAAAEVLRRGGLDAHGLQFLSMRPQDRLWLQRWLQARRAAALAALRA